VNSALVAVVGMEREARIARGATVTQRGLGVDEALRQGGRAVISFGLCGALHPDLAVGDLVIGEAVVDGRRRFECDPAWRHALLSALPGTHPALVWADGRMITSVEQKADLRKQTGATVADMESHVAASAAADFGVPFAVVRAVSDNAITAIPPAVEAGFAPNGSIRLSAIAANLLGAGTTGLSDLFELIALARRASRAFKSLETAWPAVTRASAPFATGGSP
jgi:hypothetical protein